MFEVENNSKYNELVAAYQKSGNATILDKLEGQVSAGGQGGFEEGDRIEWPSKPQFLKVKVRPNSTATAQGFVAKVTNSAGVERYQLFFPSTLGKSLREILVDKEMKVLEEKGFIRTKGTAATDYQNSANLGIDDTVRRMMTEHPEGIVVSKVEKPWTYRFQTKEPVQANLYTMDYATK